VRRYDHDTTPMDLVDLLDVIRDTDLSVDDGMGVWA
jgi:hypothetical protein